MKLFLDQLTQRQLFTLMINRLSCRFKLIQESIYSILYWKFKRLKGDVLPPLCPLKLYIRRMVFNAVILVYVVSMTRFVNNQNRNLNGTFEMIYFFVYVVSILNPICLPLFNRLHNPILIYTNQIRTYMYYTCTIWNNK